MVRKNVPEGGKDVMENPAAGRVPVPSGRGYARGGGLDHHEGHKPPHESDHLGNLIEDIIAPAISNKSRHPGNPEKVTDLLHDTHPRKSAGKRPHGRRVDVRSARGVPGRKVSGNRPFSMDIDPEVVNDESFDPKHARKDRTQCANFLPHNTHPLPWPHSAGPGPRCHAKRKGPRKVGTTSTRALICAVSETGNGQDLPAACISSNSWPRRARWLFSSPAICSRMARFSSFETHSAERM